MADFETLTENRLNDHAKRLRELEIERATQKQQIEALCNKLALLADTIDSWMSFAREAFWKVLGTLSTIIFFFAGFFVWYCKQLGGG